VWANSPVTGIGFSGWRFLSTYSLGSVTEIAADWGAVFSVTSNHRGHLLEQSGWQDTGFNIA